MPAKQQRRSDAPGAWRSISRRWRLVGALLGAGLLVAVAYTALSPRRVVANSLVLLPAAAAEGSTATTRDGGTQSRIATSAPVLRKAIKATDGSMSIADLRQRVSASAVTSSLLEVKVEDTSPHRAIRLSNAVARGYVAYSKQLAMKSGDTLVHTLRARASDLNAQLDALDAQVADQTAKVSALPQRTSSASAELNALEARRSSLAEDLADVNQAIIAAQLDSAGLTYGLQLLEPATSARGPSLSTTARPFVVAVLIALAAGSVSAFRGDRRDDRARRRKDIASAIGAPVLASLQARSEQSDPGVDGHEQANDGDERVLRQLERRLGNKDDAGGGFVVVSLSDDDAAIQAVRQLSAAAAQCGHTTAVFAPASRRPRDDVDIPLGNLRSTTPRNPMVYDSHRTLEDTASNTDLAIVLVVTDGATLEIPRWSASLPAVMIVSAGFARRDELASVSAMMRAASGPFAGVIVTNPDRRDDTSAWQVPTPEPELVPTRITGMARESTS